MGEFPQYFPPLENTIHIPLSFNETFSIFPSPLMGEGGGEGVK